MTEVPCSLVTVNAYASGALRTGDPTIGADAGDDNPLALSTRDGFDSYYRQVFGTDLQPSHLDNPGTQRQELAFLTFPPGDLDGSQVQLVVNAYWTGPAIIQFCYDDEDGARTIAEFTLPDDGLTGFRDYAATMPGLTPAMVASGSVLLNGGPAVFAYNALGLYQVYVSCVALRDVASRARPHMRHRQRGDGLGGSTAPRHRQHASRQGSLRARGFD